MEDIKGYFNKKNTAIEKTSKDIAEEMSRAVKNKVQEVIVDNEKVATKNLLESIRNKVVKENENTVGVVYVAKNKKAKKYAQVIIEGRSIGAKQPPIVNIMKWMKLKGIKGDTKAKNKSIAFVIARKISKSPAEPFNFFEIGLRNSREILSSIANKYRVKNG